MSKQIIGIKSFLFILYILFGLYIVNQKLLFVNIPETFMKVDLWIIFVGGILLIFAGLKLLVSPRKTYV